MESGYTYNFMPPLPAVPGQELSGTIEKVGAGVTTRRVGQRVYTSARERPHRGGHYAEFVATPADATFLLPDTVTFDTAATLANYQVAYHIFNDAVRQRKGQSVLIYAAAGGMGNALIDLAKSADLVVSGVVSGDEKSKFARNLGADHVIDRKAEKSASESSKSPATEASILSSIRLRDRPSPITFGCSRLAACSSSTVPLVARRNTICSQRCA